MKRDLIAGAPRRIRTYDLRIRSPLLYPAELGMQSDDERRCKLCRTEQRTVSTSPKVGRISTTGGFDSNWKKSTEWTDSSERDDPSGARGLAPASSQVRCSIQLS
jgi:hypothetical protein